jgi:WD40 repeat protein
VTVSSAEGFVVACREALESGALDRLRAHASGDSDAVRELERRLGTGERARAVARLALALAGDGDRGTWLCEAVEAWGVASAAGPAELSVATDAADAVVDALHHLCRQRHDLRLAPLHDLALELLGRPPRVLRRAAVAVPVVSGGAGRLLILEAHLLDGALPGVFESPAAAVARRDAAWRDAETTVDEVIGKLDGGAAIRYRLSDNQGDASYVEDLGGASAGMALAVAARRLLRRRELPLDRHVAITAAVAPDGKAVPIAGINAKLAVADPKTGEGDVRHLDGRVRRLLVHRDQADQLDRDRVGRDRETDRLAVVPVDLDVVGIDGLDDAARKARVSLRGPALATAAITAVVALVAVLALRPSGPDAAAERRAVEAQVPAKVASAVRRLRASDPDLADLLLAQHATVQPSPASLAALIEAHGRVEARETTFRPVSGRVSELQVAGDGSWVVTGGSNGELRLWDAAKRRERSPARASNYADEIRVIALSEDERRFAAAGSRSLVVGEVGPRRFVSSLEEDIPLGTSALTFSDDGRTLYVGAADALGVTKVDADGYWSDIDWHEVTVGDHYVRDVFPLSRRMLAYCVETYTGDQQLERLDLATDTSTAVVSEDGEPIPCPAAEVATGVIASLQGEGDRTVAIGRVEDSDWTELARHRFGEEIMLLRSVAGRAQVFAASNRTLAVLDQAGEVVAEAPLRPSDDDVAIGRGGRLLAISSRSGSVRIQPLGERRDATRERFTSPGDDVRTVAMSDDGRRLAIGGELGEVSVFDTAKPGAPPLLTREVVPGPIRTLELDATGKLAWAGGDTGQVARVPLTEPDAEIEYSAQLGDPITDIELSPDRGLLGVAGFSDTGVLTMDPGNLSFDRVEGIDALELVWLDRRRLLVASGASPGGDQSQAAVRVFDRELKRIGRIVPTQDPGIVAMRERRGLVAAAGPNGTVVLLDVRGATPRPVRTIDTASDLATGVEWSSDGRVLAVAGGDDRIDYFEAETFQRIGDVAVDDSLGGIAMARSGGRLATGSIGTSKALLIPFGVTAWSQSMCDRTRRFVSPATWLDVAGRWPPYRRACEPPS